MFYAYILHSLKDGTYYYGSTKSLEQRLKEHNNGKVRYTKGHCPYELWYHEEYPTRQEAVKREQYFKSIDGYKWLRSKNVL